MRPGGGDGLGRGMDELAGELGGPCADPRVWIVMEVAQGWFQDEGGAGRACAAFAAV